MEMNYIVFSWEETNVYVKVELILQLLVPFLLHAYSVCDQDLCDIFLLHACSVCDQDLCEKNIVSKFSFILFLN